MVNPAKKLFMIIDGHALVHRAWHALPPLTAKDGTVISGAYGFTMILLKAIRDLKPTHVAVTFDLKGPTFRHEEFAQYKATREKKPDELYAQVPIIERILAAMEIKVFTKTGFEADDLIGTLSRLAPAQSKDVETIIVTGDMDTLQLVDERTKVYTLRKGMTDTVIYDIPGVEARFGFRPIQLIDYKALRGDPSDNIPGVKGIGEKTGAELIAKFGTIEGIYAALEKKDGAVEGIKPSVIKKLEEHKADAFQAKHLCTIVRDVPMDFDLASCALRTITREKVADVFNSLQFTRLLQQLPEGEASEDFAPAGAHERQQALLPSAQEDLRKIVSAKGLSDFLKTIAKSESIAFHSVTESENLIRHEVRHFFIAAGATAAVMNGEVFMAGRAELQKFFSNPKQTKVCHDIKREIHVFSGYKLGIEGPVFDLMLASYLLHAGERRHSLAAIMSLYRSLSEGDKDADDDAKVAATGREVENFIGVAAEIRKELADNKMLDLYAAIELPVAKVLAEMERKGVAIDVPYLKEYSRKLASSIDGLTGKIKKYSDEDFNINSPAQLKKVLFEKLMISAEGIKKTAKGGTLSTAASELEKLRGSHPIIGDILEYRELSKLKSTYVDALPDLIDRESGRIHANFNQTVTATGRLSSSDPNLQNIPTSETENGRKVRNAFLAGKGAVFLAADYSQIELRIAAHLAGEKTMIAAFKRGEDIHWRTAVEMFGEKEAAEKRRIAKIINFGILYGMGPMRLAESAGISFNEAREYIERYFSIHGGIAAYIEETKKKAHELGYVETMFGRRRFFKNLNLMNRREQGEAERQAVNMPVQGTQADMTKIAMIRVNEAIKTAGLSGAMVLQVHDELVFETPRKEVDELRALVVPIMEKVIALSVPVIVNASVGERWGDMKKI